MHYIWSKNLDAATTAVTNWNEQQVCDIRVRVQGFGFTDARCLLLFLCLVTALGDSCCLLRSDFICCIDAIGDLSESWAFLVPSAVFVLCTRKYGQGAWPWPLTLTLTLKHVTWRVFRKLRRSWPWQPCVSWASRGRGEPVAPGCLVDRRAKWCYRLSLAWLEQGLLWSTRLLKRMRQTEALEAEHEESCNYEDGVCEWPRVRARFPFTYKQATFSRCFRTSSLGPAPGKCFATAALYHRRYESSADLLLLSKPWHTRMCCLHSFPSLDVMWILRSE
jgi:hypothetical protein